jgi:hypothetical protein
VAEMDLEEAKLYPKSCIYYPGGLYCELFLTCNL